MTEFKNTKKSGNKYKINIKQIKTWLKQLFYIIAIDNEKVYAIFMQINKRFEKIFKILKHFFYNQANQNKSNLFILSIVYLWDKAWINLYLIYFKYLKIVDMFLSDLKMFYLLQVISLMEIKLINIDCFKLCRF